ncbi:MAG: MFS transporter [Novosphingobium sp.]|nr:MFS transporter [Novosphingobium sp.]
MHSPQTQDTGRFPMREGEFVGLMAMLMALQALAIDVMLPALGVMSRELGVSDANDRQLVIGVFLVCSGLASLVPGSIADRFGRRPVILACLGAYFVISLASVFVSDFTHLLVLRALLGLFTSGLMVMPMAVVRDRFEGDRMARTQSLIAMTFMVVPMLAPLLGQAVMLAAGWRAIFGVMALLALVFGAWAWLRLPETLHDDHKQEIRPRVVLANMRTAVTRRDAVGYFLAAALVQGALLGYINSAQQLVAEALGAGAAFPTIFGVMALLMAATNFVNSRIVERFGARRVSHAALIGYILSAALHVWFAATGRETLWVFVLLMTVNMCFMSFIGANFQSIALQPFARIAGAAASALSFIRLVAGALLGLLIGQAFDGTAVPITGAMVLAGLGSLLLVLFSEKGVLFRRLHYPTYP